MPGMASQRVRIFIMHFSAQQTISPTIPFRGNNGRRVLERCFRSVTTDERQGGNAQRLIDATSAIGGQGRPRAPFDDHAEQHKTQVAVQALTIRRIFDGFVCNGFQQRVQALPAFVFIAGRNPR